MSLCYVDQRISSSLGEIVAMHADRDKREVGMSSKAASQPTRGALRSIFRGPTMAKKAEDGF